MWGFGSVRLRAFTKLSFMLIRKAWKDTRQVAKGDKLVCTIELDVE